jgi:hypothetical protein
LTEEGRRKKEEGRRKTEDGRRKKEEGRRKKEEGRRKKEEGWRADIMYKLMVFVPVLYFFFCDFSGFFSFPLSSSPLIITHFCFPILSFSSTSIR